MYYLVYTEEHGYELVMFPYRYQAEEHCDELRKYRAYRDVIIQVHSIAQDYLYDAAEK